MKLFLPLLPALLLAASTSAQVATHAPAERPGLTATELGYDIAETGLDGRTFVVAPDGDDDNPGSEDRPMKTPQAAADRTEPGDTVLLREGTYTNEGDAPVLRIQTSGTRRNWIRYASYPGETAVIRFDSIRGIHVTGADFIVIEGFEVIGAAEGVDPGEALEHALAFKGEDHSRSELFNVGIRLGDAPDDDQHHVIIRGNRIHHTSGGGVASARSDYVLVEGNEIFKTSFYSPWGESGVSLWRSVDSDGDRRSYKMVVKDNLIYQNDNLVPFWMMESYSDGNAIILDANMASPGAGSEGHKSYNGRFLVVNNVCFGNGGRGVNIFESENADILHNTLYRNAARENIENEVELGRTDRINLQNNILAVRDGKHAVGGYQTERATIDFNLVSGGEGFGFRTGKNQVEGDPSFAAVPAENPTPGDPPASWSDDAFRLTEGSPAVGAGSPDATFPVDMHGRERDAQEPDLGAMKLGG